MNNDLEQFSEERLKEIANFDEDAGLYPSTRQCKALARIALASKHAKSAELDRTNAFTDEDLEGMAHGNNPVANAYRELLAFRRAAKQAKPVVGIEPLATAIMKTIDAETDKFHSVYTLSELRVAIVKTLSALTTPQPAHTEQAIPDGWKLVPIEPTDAMCDVSHVGVDVFGGVADDEYYSIGGEYAAKVYRAMLAASPKPESE